MTDTTMTNGDEVGGCPMERALEAITHEVDIAAARQIAADALREAE
jgi:hypothetical protein